MIVIAKQMGKKKHNLKHHVENKHVFNVVD